MTHCTVVGISLAAVLCVATGCIPGEPRDVATCEAVTKSALKAPSTYRLVETTRDVKPGLSRIFLKFDAENSFGASLRGLAVCEFAPGTSADTENPQLVSAQVNGQRVSGPAIDFSSARAAGR